MLNTYEKVHQYMPYLHAVSLATYLAASYGKCVPSFLLPLEGVGSRWEEAPGYSAITGSRNWTGQV